MKRVVPEVVPPEQQIVSKYFPVIGFEKVVAWGKLLTNVPIYFSFAFRYNNSKFVDQCDEEILGVKYWGGEYSSEASEANFLGPIHRSGHEACGSKYVDLSTRYVTPSITPRMLLRPLTPPVAWSKLPRGETVRLFNKWYEDQIQFDPDLPTSPNYATLVLARLYFMKGMKSLCISPYGCGCYEDQETTRYEWQKICRAEMNCPLQKDGYEISFNKGFVIVLPCEKYLQSNLVWNRIFKEEQIAYSKRSDINSGWDHISLTDRNGEAKQVQFSLVQALSILSVIRERFPGVSKDLSKSDLFSRFNNYNAITDSTAIYNRAARRFKATQFVWKIIRNVNAMRMAGRWEKKSIWIGSLPKGFDENSIDKYLPWGVKEKLRNIQLLKETNCCFLNFEDGKTCKRVYDFLTLSDHGKFYSAYENDFKQMKVEYAKKKRFKPKKGNNQPGRCFKCGIKGHKESECYYSNESILPLEIWSIILDHVTLKQLGKLAKICKYWNGVVFNYWKTIVPLTYIHSGYKITPLHAAVWLENIAMVKFFIRTGPKEWLDAQDQLGHTPLHYACALQNNLIFTELRSNGANTKIRDKEGHTAEYLMGLEDKGLSVH